MLITLYEKPDYDGKSFTFDPQKVQTIISVEKNGTAQFSALDAQLIFWASNLVEFSIGSIRNNTEQFFLIIIDNKNNLAYPFYGSKSNTKFIDSSVLGYIRVEKYPKTYKTEMIVFICLFVLIFLLFSVLFITGYIKIHKTTLEY